MTSTAIEFEIDPSTAKQLDRPIFGHVVDGEAVASLDGATMDVVDPSTGAVVAQARRWLGRRCRPGRPLGPGRVRRWPLA